MVFTHRIADDTRRLTVRPVITDTQLIHIIKRPPLYGFEPVAHVGKRSGNNDAHRIIDKRFLHDLGIFGFDNSVIFHDKTAPSYNFVCSLWLQISAGL